MKKLLTGLVLVLSSLLLTFNTASAEDNLYTFTVTWDIPTQRVDGSTLTLGEIGGYQLEVTQPDGSVDVQMVTGATTVQYLYPIQEAGSYTFVMKTYDSDSIYSGGSDPIVKAIGNPIAKIQGMTVTVTCESGSSCTFNVIGETPY